MIKFHIISTGWKCEDTIQKCMHSVKMQDYNRNLVYHSIIQDGCGHIVKTPTIVVDHQTGGTPWGRWVVMHRRFGKLYNFHLAAQEAEPTDIIGDLDLDDTLPPDALETVARVYEEHPETLLTHGSYRMESGKPARFNGPYEDEKFRAAPWRGTHFKTFKASLFHRIKTNDFKGPPDGGWLMSGADMAMMLPMLELAGLDRIKYIDKEIYVYNDISPLNDHKTDPELQKTVERYLRKKKPYRRI